MRLPSLLGKRCPLCGASLPRPPDPPPEAGRKGGMFDPDDPSQPFFDRGAHEAAVALAPRSRDPFDPSQRRV